MDCDFYNRHYLMTREDGAIIDAWSDGPFAGRSTDGYSCFNEKGSYQLRLVVDGVETDENPDIFTGDGIPLFRWDGEAVHKRTAEEIEAERAKLPAPAPGPLEQLRADVDFVMVMTDLM